SEGEMPRNGQALPARKCTPTTPPRGGEITKLRVALPRTTAPEHARTQLGSSASETSTASSPRLITRSTVPPLGSTRSRRRGAPESCQMRSTNASSGGDGARPTYSIEPESTSASEARPRSAPSRRRAARVRPTRAPPSPPPRPILAPTSGQPPRASTSGNGAVFLRLAVARAARAPMIRAPHAGQRQAVEQRPDQPDRHGDQGAADA